MSEEILPVTSEGDRNQGPTLLDYLEVLVKQRKVIAIITVTATLITLIYSLTLPNIYSAQTLILPTQDDKNMSSSMLSQLGGMAALAGVSVSVPNNTDLYASLLKSEAIKDQVIDRFKLMDILGKKLRVDAYRHLDTAVQVKPGKKDGIIAIAVSDWDPARSAELANAYVEELGKLIIKLNISGAGKNRIFLEARLAKARADLVQAEDKLKSFQSQNKAISVSEQTKASIEGIARLKAELASREVQLNVLHRSFTETSQEVKNAIISVEQLRSQVARMEGSSGSSFIPTAGSAPAIGQEYVRLMREFKIQESLVELLTKQYEMSRINEAKEVTPFQIIQKARQPERKSKPSRARMVLTTAISALFFSLFLVFVRENFSNMPEERMERWKGIFNLRS